MHIHIHTYIIIFFHILYICIYTYSFNTYLYTHIFDKRFTKAHVTQNVLNLPEAIQWIFLQSGVEPGEHKTEVRHQTREGQRLSARHTHHANEIQNWSHLEPPPNMQTLQTWRHRQTCRLWNMIRVSFSHGAVQKARPSIKLRIHANRMRTGGKQVFLTSNFPRHSSDPMRSAGLIRFVIWIPQMFRFIAMKVSASAVLFLWSSKH